MWKKSRSQQSIKTGNHINHNFHKSLRFVFVIAQLFGYFPVLGVLSSSPSSVGFSWFSLRALSSTVTYTSGIIIILGHIRLLIVEGYDQFEMNGVIFYTSGTLSCIFFTKLATEWKKIMLRWQEADRAMASYGWPKNLDRRLKIISIIFLLLEAAEHLSIQANKLIVAIQCKDSISKGFEHFSVNMSFPTIFHVIEPYYSAWLGVFLQCVNTRMAFSWTFIDLFIILISCALATRFRQVNNRVRCMKDMKVQSERSWGSVNEDYNRLCNLCAFLDDKISYLILVSFFTNFYFIIFQVFDSLSLHRATPLEIIYYFISLGLLILRMATICVYGSWINEESKISVDLLLSTSHEIYNKEIQRFMDSVKYQNPGLTGKSLFRITKRLILQITSAVVTYELVVIQFSKNWSKEDQPSKNSIC